MLLSQNALRIDSEAGAVIAHNLRIEPDWTVEKLRESEFYKRYIHKDKLEKVKTFLISNLNNKRLIIDVYYFNHKKTLAIDKIKLKFSHGGRAENEMMRFDDFKAFRETLVESFEGYVSEVDHEDYVRYRFQWGSIVLGIDQRDLYTDLNIYYK